MADFCNFCNEKYGLGVDIDLVEIAKCLDKGRSCNFLCEGCNRRTVYKDEIGVVYEGVEIDGVIELRFVDWVELNELHQKNWLQRLLSNFKWN